MIFTYKLAAMYYYKFLECLDGVLHYGHANPMDPFQCMCGPRHIGPNRSFIYLSNLLNTVWNYVH